MLPDFEGDAAVLDNCKVSKEGVYLGESNVGVFALSVIRLKVEQKSANGKVRYKSFDNSRRSVIIPAFLQLVYLWFQSKGGNG